MSDVGDTRTFFLPALPVGLVMDTCCVWYVTYAEWHILCLFVDCNDLITLYFCVKSLVIAYKLRTVGQQAVVSSYVPTYELNIGTRT